MNIAVIGTGNVGVVVGTGFAENGHRVSCVDKSDDRIRALSEGALPIHEPGLKELVARNIEEERLRFTTDLNGALGDCLIVFVCVDTPRGPDGEADLSQIFSAAEGIGDALTDYAVVVMKSTCPVGTAERVEETLKERAPCAFDVVVNPEFMTEGNAVDDFMRPDRVVIGCNDVRIIEIIKELYAPFLRSGKPLLIMDPRSAELSKYAAAPPSAPASRLSTKSRTSPKPMAPISTMCGRR
ncbi:MAG: nucleotide sugar dehydrogenase [Candidatus Hydrogenedentes bacterium]|nr:nucleotide sugar dehydrogenase [Candidatus Hydrogenedentota bacterium]